MTDVAKSGKAIVAAIDSIASEYGYTASWDHTGGGCRGITVTRQFVEGSEPTGRGSDHRFLTVVPTEDVFTDFDWDDMSHRGDEWDWFDVIAYAGGEPDDCVGFVNSVPDLLAHVKEWLEEVFPEAAYPQSELVEALQGCDPKGHWNDASCEAEGMPVLTLNEARQEVASTAKALNITFTDFVHTFGTQKDFWKQVEANNQARRLIDTLRQVEGEIRSLSTQMYELTVDDPETATVESEQAGMTPEREQFRAVQAQLDAAAEAVESLINDRL